MACLLKSILKEARIWHNLEADIREQDGGSLAKRKRKQEGLSIRKRKSAEGKRESCEGKEEVVTVKRKLLKET
jgi:hypothetical protein